MIQNCWREHPRLADVGFCIANEIDADDFPACILNQVAARDLASRQIILGSRRGAGGGSDFRPEFFHAFCGRLDPSDAKPNCWAGTSARLRGRCRGWQGCSRSGERAGSHCRAMGAGRKSTDGTATSELDAPALSSDGGAIC